MHTRTIVTMSVIGGVLTTISGMIGSVLLGMLVMFVVDPASTLPPCATEDSVSCVWDASQRGNGQGRSFWTDADGNRYPL